MSSDDKHKHLDFIQVTIVRMAANSFLLKAWTVTLVAAVFALSAKDSNKTFLLVSFIPVLLFWVLDGYFLHLERAYRHMYDTVRNKPNRSIDFDLNYKPHQAKCEGWFSSIFSPTLLVFYIGLLILQGSILALVFLNLFGGNHV